MFQYFYFSLFINMNVLIHVKDILGLGFLNIIKAVRGKLSCEGFLTVINHVLYEVFLLRSFDFLIFSSRSLIILLRKSSYLSIRVQLKYYLK